MLELREKGFNVPEGILTVDEAMDCISSLLDKEGKYGKRCCVRSVFSCEQRNPQM